MRAKTPGATLERVPMLRGRIVAAGGTKAEDLKPAEGSAWVLRGDRGITYAPALPAGSRLVAGGSFALLGCTVSPGFEFEDYEAGKRDELIAQWPEHAELIRMLTK